VKLLPHGIGELAGIDLHLDGVGHGKVVPEGKT
jgi:hypothetical protein